jgi:hypothetical protein
MFSGTVTGELGFDVRVSSVRNTTVATFLVHSRPRARAPSTTVRCSLWGPRAEELAPDLRRGAIVVCSGSLMASVNREGRLRIEMRVSECEVVVDPPDDEDGTDDYTDDENMPPDELGAREHGS